MKAELINRACQRCGKPFSEHGPERQCPCIVYTHEGSFVKWNRCTFLGLEIAAPQGAGK